MQVSAGSCADPSIAILASVGLRLAPIGWERSYHSIDTVTDKTRRGNQPELIPFGESDMRNDSRIVGCSETEPLPTAGNKPKPAPLERKPAEPGRAQKHRQLPLELNRKQTWPSPRF